MVFESVVIAYLTFFAFAALFALAPRARRVRVALTAAACALVLIVVMQEAPLPIRLCLALAYLPLGYWLPAPLVSPRGETSFERWLWRTETMLGTVAIPLPQSIRHLTEASYLACYPMVPIAFGLTWSVGTQPDVERFWNAVIIAGYLCYATLPWLVSRPPRAIERTASQPAGLARVNLAVLDRVSHDLVTFPSAHVAVASAAAIAVSAVWLPAGLALGAVAAGVAIGAVAGRYHFAVDVMLGAVVGIAAATWFAFFS